MNRREFTRHLAFAATFSSVRFTRAARPTGFRFNYLVGSSMYGELPLSEILPDVRKTGAGHIDIWPRKHGNQREQI